MHDFKSGIISNNTCVVQLDKLPVVITFHEEKGSAVKAEISRNFLEYDIYDSRMPNIRVTAELAP
jgi:hypothetical protein